MVYGCFSSTRGEKGTDLVSQADLQKANRRVADALRRITDLKAHIEQRQRAGRDASDAIELLAIFEISLDVMIEHRDRLAEFLRDPRWPVRRGGR